ncbi:hypothetical protein ACP26C_00890 [Franconibacter helveticus 513]|uniref:hypothetical protein n=1 Tax=Franconibacter helveticus TaxID=357240 RepID=UPI000467D10D|nr:hypothetical protein [Franconibacter helveticus]MDU6926841.1 hypothetical protein [Franconibacter helveticus]
MIDILKELKCCFTMISPDKNTQEELNIFYSSENYDGYANEFKSAVKLLSQTIEKNDKIAIQCALTRVRIASLNLSNLYQDIIDDAILINKHDSWPDIPEGYRLPESYTKK